jgi:signal peptidase II
MAVTESRPRASRARLAGVFVAVAGAVYVADRVTKLLAERHLAGREPVTVIPGVLDLRYTTNSGGAFGVLGGAPWLFFTAAVGVGAIVLVAAWRTWSIGSEVGLGLVFGGALGNLTDRVLHASRPGGQVTDFIHLHHWPVFNVADSCIVIGALVLAVAGGRRRDRATGGR